MSWNNGKQKGKIAPAGKVALNQTSSFLKRCIYIMGCFIHTTVMGKIQLQPMLQWLPWIWLGKGRERSLQMGGVERAVTRQAVGYSSLKQLWRGNSKRRARGQNLTCYMMWVLCEWGGPWELWHYSKGKPYGELFFLLKVPGFLMDEWLIITHSRRRPTKSKLLSVAMAITDLGCVYSSDHEQH